MFLSTGPSIDAFSNEYKLRRSSLLTYPRCLIDGISFVALACTASSLSISFLRKVTKIVRHTLSEVSLMHYIELILSLCSLF